MHAKHSTIYSVDINNPKIQDFIDEMQKTYGINASYVSSILQGAEYQQSIIDAISSPAEFTWTWDRYRKLFIEEQRINNGKAFLSDYQETFIRAEMTYGVPRRLLLLFWELRQDMEKLWASTR